ncbi:hypothetical protein [Paraburkholderia sp. BCC1884]|uniref:hypothetical protein n=1 Tax=Paraburkholderia sp. BCC1884 TaxID=2562668 RepID=UPI001183029A|nr:hypothetical protein [Paraburkholderia sp. BCC1884]
MKMISLMLAAALVFGAQASSAQTAAITGKNYGGVNLHAVAARGAAGRPISVEVRYEGLPATGHTRVTYTTEGALKLSGPAQKTLTPDSKGADRDTVVVQAASDGTYFLNVFATTTSGTSVLSIPVTVGSAMFKPRAAAAGSAVSASGGQRVIEMPAQEIRH